MLLYFLALSAAAAVLYRNNPGARSNRRGAGFLFCAALGGLAYALRDDAAPALSAGGYTGISEAAAAAAVALEWINQAGTPYGAVLFAVSYAGVLGRDTEKKLAASLAVPPVLTAVFTQFTPELVIPYRLLLLWAGPYYLAANAFFLLAWYREAHAARRRNRLVTAVIVVPTLLCVLVFINVARALRPDFDFEPYISAAVLYSFGAAALFIFLDGVLGVRLRFERDPWETAMKAASAGASLLTHAVKSETAKISISAENVRTTAGPEAVPHVRVIERAAEHLQDMAERVQGRMREIVLAEEPCRLPDLAADAAEDIRPLLAGKRIDFEWDAKEEVTLLCDPVHMREVIGLLLQNAVEAIGDKEGAVRLMCGIDRKGAFIRVADNGPGIPEEVLPYVREPFFTTKYGGANYGLGLAYAHHVVRRSGGALELKSGAGRGTEAVIRFPRKKTAERMVRT